MFLIVTALSSLSICGYVTNHIACPFLLFLPQLVHDSDLLRAQIDQFQKADKEREAMWHEQTKRMRSEYEKLLQRNADIVQESQRAAERNMAAMDAVKREARQRQKETRDAERALHDMKARNAELDKALGLSRAETERSKAQMRPVEDALAKIEREVKISREKHEEQMMLIEEEMIAHRDAYEAEKRKGAHREKTVADLQRQLAAKTKVIGDHREEIDLIKAELVDTQSARDRIVAEKSQGETKAREAKLAMQQKQRATEERVRAEKNKVKELENRVGDLETELDAARQLLREKRQELVKAGASEADVADLRKLKSRLAAKSRECEALQQRVVELEAQVEDQKMLKQMLANARMDAEKNKRLSLMLGNSRKSFAVGGDGSGNRKRIGSDELPTAQHFPTRDELGLGFVSTPDSGIRRRNTKHGISPRQRRISSKIDAAGAFGSWGGGRARAHTDGDVGLPSGEGSGGGSSGLSASTGGGAAKRTRRVSTKGSGVRSPGRQQPNMQASTKMPIMS